MRARAQAVRAPSSWGHLHQLERHAPEFERHIGPLKQRASSLVGAAGGWRSILARRILGWPSMFAATGSSRWRIMRGLPSAWVHPGLNDYSGSRTHYAFPTRKISPGRGRSAYRLSESRARACLVSRNGRPERTHVANNHRSIRTCCSVPGRPCLRRHSDARDAHSTREEVRIFYVGEGATADAYGACRTAPTRRGMWSFARSLRVEGMQQAGRRGLPGRRLSPVMDQPTHHSTAGGSQMVAGVSGAPR